MHRRTALITAASIAAVVLTGATAVGANIGILSSASASAVGDLTAVAQVETIGPVPTAAATTTSGPTTTPDGSQMTTQAFEADAAGVVEVQFGSGQLRLGSVAPAVGWTWSSTQEGDGVLVVNFVGEDGAELSFVAELLPDGTLTARVDGMIVETIQGEAEVIIVHEQATAVASPPPARSATTSPGSTSSGSSSNSSATPGPIVVPVATSSASATSGPASVAEPTSTAGRDSDDDHDDGDHVDADDDHADDDGHQDDDGHEDEDGHDDEDEQHYEGADDDD